MESSDKSTGLHIVITGTVGESLEISISLFKDEKTIFNDDFNYKLEQSNNTIKILKFKDYLLLYNNRKMLCQMKNSIVEDCTIKTADYKDKNVAFYIIPPALKSDFRKIFDENNYSKYPDHYFNRNAGTWNALFPEYSVPGYNSPFIRRVKSGDVTRKSIYCWVNSTISFEAYIPTDSWFASSLAIVPRYVTDANDIEFQIKVTNVNNAEESLYKKVQIPKDKFESWTFFDYSLNIGKFAGKRCLIQITPGSKHNKSIVNPKTLCVIGSPRLLTKSQSESKNVILILLDTLRADHLGIYGYKRDTSTNIDTVAGDGVYFDQAIATSSWTLPSHMSLFTSRYPYETGYVGNSYRTNARISNKIFTIADYLSSEQYHTIAITNGSYVSSIFNFDKGFDAYYENKLGFADAVDLARKQIIKNHGNKFFLFLHTYEIHEPYSHTHYTSELPSNSSLQEKITARYDSGIRYTDNHLGKFIAFLRSQGLHDNTLIIITSDHGENFNRLKKDINGESVGTHGYTLYDSETRIPLVLYDKKFFTGGIQIKDQVSSVDILPTILDWTGIEIPDNIRGKSLFHLLKQKKSKQRIAYSEATKVTEKFAVRSKQKKLILSLKKRKKRTVEVFEFFDLKTDPLETKNIISKNNNMKGFLKLRLLEILKSINKNKKNLNSGKNRRGTGGDQLEDDLRNLGYIN